MNPEGTRDSCCEDGNLCQRHEEEANRKTVRLYRILAVCFGLLGAPLLIVAIVAVVMEKTLFVHRAKPYYVGGFVVGILNLVSALFWTCVFLKATKIDSEVKKSVLACIKWGYFIVSILMQIGCHLGGVMACFGLFNEDETAENNWIRNALGGVIFVLSIISYLPASVSLVMTLKIKSYSGVVLQNRHGAEVVISSNNGTNPTGPDTIHTTASGKDGMITTQFDMNSGNNKSVREMEQENCLLQQLKLQRHLNQQNPSSYPPPLPPSYGFSHPSASVPPPSYDSVKYR